MARAQQQGSSAITIWFIVVMVLFVASIVTLVVIYTDQEQLRNDRVLALAAKSRAITDAEERSIPLAREAREGGPTVASLLEDARAEAAQLATGDPASDTSAIRVKRDELISRIQARLRSMAEEDGSLSAEVANFDDVSLFDGFEGVFRLFQREHDLRVDAETHAQELSTGLDQAIQESAKQKSDFDERGRQLQAKLTDAERSRAQYSTERDNNIAQIERQYEDARHDCTATITEARRETAAWRQRYAEVLQRYSELTAKLGTLQVSPQELATARKPDGRIVMAKPGDDAIYIDLGERDALVLGMEFAVYSAQTGIPEDGRAKASVRVESIGPKSSECKVLWVASQEIILENDLIANPVYDRDRPLSFMVVGEFDVDRDGRIDRDGALRIEALVENWGGRVGSELTALTDFVVVGAPPLKPQTAGTVSAEIAARNEAVQRNYERYTQVVETAKTLSIPILTQEVFRNFLGYGQSYRYRR